MTESEGLISPKGESMLSAIDAVSENKWKTATLGLLLLFFLMFTCLCGCLVGGLIGGMFARRSVNSMMQMPCYQYQQPVPQYQTPGFDQGQ